MPCSSAPARQGTWASAAAVLGGLLAMTGCKRTWLARPPSPRCSSAPSRQGLGRRTPSATRWPAAVNMWSRSLSSTTRFRRTSRPTSLNRRPHRQEYTYRFCIVWTSSSCIIRC